VRRLRSPKRVVLVLAIAAAPSAYLARATDAPASLGATSELTLSQVHTIALRQAAQARDAHPSSITMASGSLRRASRVMDPSGILFPEPTPEEEAQLRSTFDLVVMRGRFFPVHSERPPSRPHHAHHASPVAVIELLIDAHAGFVDGRYFGDTEPAPLARLGPVTRLR
jgi:hypothetical protein